MARSLSKSHLIDWNLDFQFLTFRRSMAQVNPNIESIKNIKKTSSFLKWNMDCYQEGGAHFTYGWAMGNIWSQSTNRAWENDLHED